MQPWNKILHHTFAHWINCKLVSNPYPHENKLKCLIFNGIPCEFTLWKIYLSSYTKSITSTSLNRTLIPLASSLNSVVSSTVHAYVCCGVCACARFCVWLCAKFCCINCVGNKNWVLKRFNGIFRLAQPYLPVSFFHFGQGTSCLTSVFFLFAANGSKQYVCLYKAFWLCQFCIFILCIFGAMPRRGMGICMGGGGR